MDHRQTYDLVTDFDPLHRIGIDTLGLADAAEGNLGAAVPSCPGWSVADLAWHLLEVQFFWATVVGQRLQDPGTYTEPPRPHDDELLGDLRAGAARLVETLRAADPAEPVFTWASRNDAGWVVRHQVQEAAVHRWDAEAAAGHGQPIDADAATDGIEEFLRYSTPFRAEDAAPVGGTLVLLAADTGFAWSVEEDAAGSSRWRRHHAEGEVTGAGAVITAAASDLLLYLYRRRSAAELPVTGDPAVAERFALHTPTS